MNDTLWKIKRQALYAAGHLGDDEYFEKIVELTVRECAEYITEYFPHSQYEARQMKKHFGVEE